MKTFALVTPTGRYHGHVGNEQEARSLEIVRKADANSPVRLVDESEWATISKAPDQASRAGLCATLGTQL